jgi:hypothetical protein
VCLAESRADVPASKRNCAEDSQLDEDWQGMSALQAPVIGGAMISLGMRVDESLGG